MNGMDMNMDGPMPLAPARMLAYLHFTPGDTVWFQGWVPASAGAMVGTCIGLFMFALLERWVAAIRAVALVQWKKRAYIEYSNREQGRAAAAPVENRKSVSSTDDAEGAGHTKKSNVSTSTVPVVLAPLSRRTIAPFNLAHDLPRGLLFAVQMALGYAFMLVVMTYQVGFILAIVIGLGVGEMIFGRYLDMSDAPTAD